jgi:hypothetical protein
VDGHAFEQRFGFHTESESHAWLQIDLGRPYDLTGARIFGRHDCCFEQSTPMSFLVSDDGREFRDVALRGEALDQVDPWELQLDHVRARYVRVARTQAGVLVLSEVQVFGQAP